MPADWEFSSVTLRPEETSKQQDVLGFEVRIRCATVCEITMRKEFFVKLTIALIAVIAALVDGAGFNASASASDRWHVEVTRPVESQEIQFTNGNAHLVGTVYLPRTGNHLSAVVVLHDASIPTRESALYRHLREGLPALGFAVLIYDRRGTGESSGDRHVDYETLADDAIAGQRALAKLPRIDPARIGFWGLSQGGWLAVLAAGRSQQAAFGISISAPLVTADEQMQFATSNLLTIRGYSPLDVREMLEAAVDALRRSESKPWFDISYLPSVSRLTADPEHDPNRRTLDDDPVALFARPRSRYSFSTETPIRGFLLRNPLSA